MSSRLGSSVLPAVQRPPGDRHPSCRSRSWTAFAQGAWRVIRSGALINSRFRRAICRSGEAGRAAPAAVGDESERGGAVFFARFAQSGRRRWLWRGLGFIENGVSAAARGVVFNESKLIKWVGRPGSEPKAAHIGHPNGSVAESQATVQASRCRATLQEGAHRPRSTDSCRLVVECGLRWSSRRLMELRRPNRRLSDSRRPNRRPTTGRRGSGWPLAGSGSRHPLVFTRSETLFWLAAGDRAGVGPGGSAGQHGTAGSATLHP